MTQTVSLGDICIKVTSGGTPSTKHPEYYNGDIPWLRTQEVNFGYIHNTEKTITDSGLKNSSAKLIPENSVIIAMYGVTAGKSAINKIPLTTNQACCNLIIDHKKADYRYVYYHLLNNYEKLKNAATGAAQQNLGAKQIAAMQIVLPLLVEQTKIADFLSTIDEKIELNRNMNDKLEQMGQALFRHHFITSPEAMGWSKIAIGKKIHPKRGRSLQSRDMKEGPVPVVSGGLQPAGYHNEANTKEPVITVSASGANAGFVALWEQPVWSADSCFIDSTITDDVYFYYLFMKSQQDVIYGMQTGSGQPHIYPKHIELLEIPDVPDKVMSDFRNTVEPLFKKIHQNKVAIKTLTGLRDTLLPRLISGKIKV